MPDTISPWAIELARCRTMFEEWQTCLNSTGADSMSTVAAARRFTLFEQHLRERLQSAIHAARENQRGRAKREGKAGRRAALWLEKLEHVRDPAKPKAPPKRYRYEGRCVTEHTRPVFVGEDGKPRRIIGLAWNPRKEPIGNGGPGFKMFAGGWSIRINTIDGKYLNTSPPDMGTDQLAMEIDALRFRMLQSGLFGTRKRNPKHKRHTRLGGTWNYPAMAQEWLEGKSPPMVPCPEIEEHFAKWLAAGEEVARARAAGFLHTTRHSVRPKTPKWMRE